MVTDITPDPVVTVVTNKATFKAKQLVITAGAWAPTLLKKLGIHLPFKVIIRLCLLRKIVSLIFISTKKFVNSCLSSRCEGQYLQTKVRKKLVGRLKLKQTPSFCTLPCLCTLCEMLHELHYGMSIINDLMISTWWH